MESNKKKASRPKKKNGPAKKKSPNASSKASRGSELLNQVIRMSGIPAGSIQKDLKTILERKNLDENNLTLDQLRVVVASYLREIMASILEKRPDPTSKTTRH